MLAGARLGGFGSLVASRLALLGWVEPGPLALPACRFAARSAGLGGTWAAGSCPLVALRLALLGWVEPGPLAPVRLSLCDSLFWVGWNLGRWLLPACRFATRCF